MIENNQIKSKIFRSILKNIALQNYGLIEKVDSQYNYIKYKLTKLGERFYSFIDFENIYKELIDELQQFKK